MTGIGYVLPRGRKNGQAILLAWLLASLSIQKLVAVDDVWNYTVQLSASVQASPPQIQINWPQDTSAVPNSYVIYRKNLDDMSWGNGVTLSGSTTSYTDYNVSVGTAYEYQVVKNANGYKGYGYLYSGIQVAAVENRGTILLVVDDSFSSSLSSELTRLQQDLVGDGWYVIRIDVSRNASVTTVKSQIAGYYWADPSNIKAVFLFGHIPVPYSGNLAPDEHVPDHRGAWPADVYYGEMDGSWTDNTVNSTTAIDARNRNVPGDGKFDQTFLPSSAELAVGRVDLANMPGRLVWNGPATFPSELELLRNYLNKDHNFRHRIISAPEQGLLYDGFGNYNGMAFAASGYRNFSTFFGTANETVAGTGQWISYAAYYTYLWAYACGSGTYTSMSGIGSHNAYYDGITTDIFQTDTKAVFTMLYGSWFGDWDSEDCFLRSILATPTYGLAAVWSGTPHWYLQHMALGETIGFSTRLTQNNSATGLYRNQTNGYANQVQIALMGDPALRMHIVTPVQNLTATPGYGTVALNWSAPADAIVGYNVYRASNPLGPFSRINGSLVTTTTFTDTTSTGASAYMVRAVKLQTSASGSYYNLSQGLFVSGTPLAGLKPTLTVSASDPSASRVGPDPGSWLLSRSGTTSGDLTVNFSFSGTAAKFTDFRRSQGDMPESLVIPSGASSATLTVYPVASTTLVGDETATLTILQNSAYDVGAQNVATITIGGNAINTVKASRSGSGVALNWPGSAGHGYHVLTKANSTNAPWADAGVDINASVPTTSWFDPSSPGLSQRYYRVFQSR